MGSLPPAQDDTCISMVWLCQCMRRGKNWGITGMATGCVCVWPTSGDALGEGDMPQEGVVPGSNLLPIPVWAGGSQGPYVLV